MVDSDSTARVSKRRLDSENNGWKKKPPLSTHRTSVNTPDSPPLNPLTHGENQCAKTHEGILTRLFNATILLLTLFTFATFAQASSAGERQDGARQIRRSARPELQVRAGRQDAGRGVYDLHPEDDFTDVAFDRRGRSQRLVALDDHGQAG